MKITAAGYEMLRRRFVFGNVDYTERSFRIDNRIDEPVELIEDDTPFVVFGDIAESVVGHSFADLTVTEHDLECGFELEVIFVVETAVAFNAVGTESLTCAVYENRHTESHSGEHRFRHILMA